MNEVQVTNRNDFQLAGRFAGQNYVFPPGKPTEIPMQAARHIFGLEQDDKRRALACLGILKDRVTYQEALAVLNKVRFVEGTMNYSVQQHGPGGGQETDPSEHPKPQPGQPPGQPPKPGPGKDEEDNEKEESGGTRPGAPKGPPGRKSEAGDPKFSASDDLKRKW
jgi:hypothetical protein